jgi:hypothetical protein
MVGSQAYLYGGLDALSLPPGPSSTLWRLESTPPGSGKAWSWQLCPDTEEDSPTPRWQHAAVEVPGWAASGLLSPPARGVESSPSKVLRKVRSSISPSASKILAPHSESMVSPTIASQLVVIGGRSSSTTRLGDVWCFDVEQERWWCPVPASYEVDPHGCHSLRTGEIPPASVFPPWVGQSGASEDDDEFPGGFASQWSLDEGGGPTGLASPPMVDVSARLSRPSLGSLPPRALSAPSTASGMFSPRAGHSAVWLPVLRAVVVFGGLGGAEYACAELHETLLLEPPVTEQAEGGVEEEFKTKPWRWSTLDVSGRPPPPRTGHACQAVGTFTMVVCGGTSLGRALQDVWILSDAISASTAGYRPVNRPGEGPASSLELRVSDTVAEVAAASVRAPDTRGLSFTRSWSRMNGVNTASMRRQQQHNGAMPKMVWYQVAGTGGVLPVPGVSGLCMVAAMAADGPRLFIFGGGSKPAPLEDEHPRIAGSGARAAASLRATRPVQEESKVPEDRVFRPKGHRNRAGEGGWLFQARVPRRAMEFVHAVVQRSNAQLMEASLRNFSPSAGLSLPGRSRPKRLEESGPVRSAHVPALRWALVPTTTAARSYPPPRVEAAAVYDAVHSRVVLFGGWSPSQGGWLSDLWAVDLLEAVGPPFTVTSIEPSRGPVIGGTLVRINGWGFNEIDTSVNPILVRIVHKAKRLDSSATTKRSTTAATTPGEVTEELMEMYQDDKNLSVVSGALGIASKPGGSRLGRRTAVAPEDYALLGLEAPSGHDDDVRRSGSHDVIVKAMADAAGTDERRARLARLEQRFPPGCFVETVGRRVSDSLVECVVPDLSVLGPGEFEFAVCRRVQASELLVSAPSREAEFTAHSISAPGRCLAIGPGVSFGGTCPVSREVFSPTASKHRPTPSATTSFLIQSRDEHGFPRTSGGDRVLVSIRGPWPMSTCADAVQALNSAALHQGRSEAKALENESDEEGRRLSIDVTSMAAAASHPASSGGVALPRGRFASAVLCGALEQGPARLHRLAELAARMHAPPPTSADSSGWGDDSGSTDQWMRAARIKLSQVLQSGPKAVPLGPDHAGKLLPATIVDMQDGWYAVTWTPPSPGAYSIEVLLVPEQEMSKAHGGGFSMEQADGEESVDTRVRAVSAVSALGTSDLLQEDGEEEDHSIALGSTDTGHLLNVAQPIAGSPFAVFVDEGLDGSDEVLTRTVGGELLAGAVRDDLDSLSRTLSEILVDLNISASPGDVPSLLRVREALLRVEHHQDMIQQSIASCWLAVGASLVAAFVRREQEAQAALDTDSAALSSNRPHSSFLRLEAPAAELHPSAIVSASTHGYKPLEGDEMAEAEEVEHAMDDQDSTDSVKGVRVTEEPSPLLMHPSDAMIGVVPSQAFWRESLAGREEEEQDNEDDDEDSIARLDASELLEDDNAIAAWKKLSGLLGLPGLGDFGHLRLFAAATASPLDLGRFPMQDDDDAVLGVGEMESVGGSEMSVAAADTRWAFAWSSLASDSESIAQLGLVSRLWAEVKAQESVANATISPLLKQQAPAMKRRVADFERKASAFLQAFQQTAVLRLPEHGHLPTKEEADVARDALVEWRADLAALNADAAGVDHTAALIGVSDAAEGGTAALSETAREMQWTSVCWKAALEGSLALDAELARAWEAADPESASSELKRLLARTKASLPPEGRSTELFRELSNRVRDARQVLQVLSMLRQPAVKQRHWDQLRASVRESHPELPEEELQWLGGPEIHPGLSLKQVAQVAEGITSFEDVIGDIVERARGEASTRSVLLRFASRWTSCAFVVTPLASSTVPEIHPPRSVVDDLAADAATAASLASGRFAHVTLSMDDPSSSAPHSHRAAGEADARSRDSGAWNHILTQSNTACVLLGEVLTAWRMLDPLFGQHHSPQGEDKTGAASDVRSALPEAATLFEEMNALVHKVAAQAVEPRHPETGARILSFSSHGSVLEDLQHARDGLARCRYALGKFLTARRRAVPSLYLASDAELVDFLALGGKDSAAALVKHSPAMIPSIRALIVATHAEGAHALPGAVAVAFSDEASKPRMAATRRGGVAEPIEWFIVGVVSVAGDEHLRFPVPVPMTGRAEDALAACVEQMYLVLASQTAAAITKHPESASDRVNWALNLVNDPSAACAQATLLSAAVHHVRETEGALRSGDRKNLQTVADRRHERLDVLIELLRRPLDRLQRLRAMSLATADAHYRDVVEELVETDDISVDALRWSSSLRPYVEPGSQFPPLSMAALTLATGAPKLTHHGGSSRRITGDSSSQTQMSNLNTTAQEHRVRVAVIGASLEYGYVYQGVPSRLVVTPLTERLYVTAAMAVRWKLVCAPQGPAGTGKTETIKDLSVATGRSCLVVNCSPEMTVERLSFLLQGVSATGSWMCFDEFNRIEAGELAACAVLFRALLDALRSEASTVLLDGQEANVHLHASCFATMNPGYAGRSELPDSLQTQLRPILVVAPDVGAIAEQLMMARGFSSARSLAARMAAVFGAASVGLPSRQQYDWGLRAIRGAIDAAGFRRRQSSSDGEDDTSLELVSTINAIWDAVGSRLEGPDAAAFAGLIVDYFLSSSSVTEAVVEDVLESCMLGTLEASLRHSPGDLHHLGADSFQASPLAHRCLEIWSLLRSRHCVALVGGAGTGKTSAWGLLGRVAGVSQISIVHANSMSAGELHGFWSDSEQGPIRGAIPDALCDSITFEDAQLSAPAVTTPTKSAQLACGTSWIVLDGAIESVWIESLNSLMDDTKMLTLPTGERLRLPQGTRLLLEAPDLRHASPATVSRCGIVHITHNNAGHNLTSAPFRRGAATSAAPTGPLSQLGRALLQSWQARLRAANIYPHACTDVLCRLVESCVHESMEFLASALRDGGSCFRISSESAVRNTLWVLECLLPTSGDVEAASSWFGIESEQAGGTVLTSPTSPFPAGRLAHKRGEEVAGGEDRSRDAGLGALATGGPSSVAALKQRLETMESLPLAIAVGVVKALAEEDGSAEAQEHVSDRISELLRPVVGWAALWGIGGSLVRGSDRHTYGQWWSKEWTTLVPPPAAGGALPDPFEWCLVPTLSSLTDKADAEEPERRGRSLSLDRVPRGGDGEEAEDVTRSGPGKPNEWGVFACGTWKNSPLWLMPLRPGGRPSLTPSTVAIPTPIACATAYWSMLLTARGRSVVIEGLQGVGKSFAALYARSAIEAASAHTDGRSRFGSVSIGPCKRQVGRIIGMELNLFSDGLTVRSLLSQSLSRRSNDAEQSTAAGIATWRDAQDMAASAFAATFREPASAGSTDDEAFAMAATASAGSTIEAEFRVAPLHRQTTGAETCAVVFVDDLASPFVPMASSTGSAASVVSVQQAWNGFLPSQAASALREALDRRATRFARSGADAVEDIPLRPMAAVMVARIPAALALPHEGSAIDDVPSMMVPVDDRLLSKAMRIAVDPLSAASLTTLLFAMSQVAGTTFALPDATSPAVVRATRVFALAAAAATSSFHSNASRAFRKISSARSDGLCVWPIHAAIDVIVGLCSTVPQALSQSPGAISRMWLYHVSKCYSDSARTVVDGALLRALAFGEANATLAPAAERLSRTISHPHADSASQRSLDGARALLWRRGVSSEIGDAAAVVTEEVLSGAEPRASMAAGGFFDPSDADGGWDGVSGFEASTGSANPDDCVLELVSARGAVSLRAPLFAPFAGMLTVHGDHSRGEADSGEPADLLEAVSLSTVQRSLAASCDAAGLNLVLFPALTGAVISISRAVVTPGASILLEGPTGCGRTSMSRLAALACGVRFEALNDKSALQEAVVRAALRLEPALLVLRAADVSESLLLCLDVLARNDPNTLRHWLEGSYQVEPSSLSTNTPAKGTSAATISAALASVARADGFGTDEGGVWEVFSRRVAENVTVCVICEPLGGPSVRGTLSWINRRAPTLASRSTLSTVRPWTMPVLSGVAAAHLASHIPPLLPPLPSGGPVKSKALRKASADWRRTIQNASVFLYQAFVESTNLSSVGATLGDDDGGSGPPVVEHAEEDQLLALPEVQELLSSVAQHGAQTAATIALEAVKMLPLSFHSNVAAACRSNRHSSHQVLAASPALFLSLLTAFNEELKHRHAELGRRRMVLMDGLDRLRQAREDAASLEVRLLAAAGEADAKKQEAAKIALAAEADRAEASEASDHAEEEARKALAARELVEKQKQSAQEALEAAQPMIEAALEALDTVTKPALTECRTMQQPPPGVGDVFSVVSVLLAGVFPHIPASDGGVLASDAEALKWGSVKRYLLRDIGKLFTALRELPAQLDRREVPPSNLSVAKDLVEKSALDPEVIGRRNRAAAGLTSWALNILRLEDVLLKVQPLRESVKVAEEDEAKALSAVEVARQCAAEAMTKVEEASKALSVAQEAADAAAADARRLEDQLSLSKRLLGAVKVEGARWAAQLELTQEEEAALPGRAAIAAVTVVLGAPIGEAFVSTSYENSWRASMERLGLETKLPETASPVEALRGLLVDDPQVSLWQSQGLPGDFGSSLAAASVVTHLDGRGGNRWPMVIDEGGGALGWLRGWSASRGRGECVEVSASEGHAALRDALERAQREECVLLVLMDTGSVPPVSLSSTLRSGVQRDTGFALVVVCQEPQRASRISVAGNMAMVNFPVSESATAERLLVFVVERERSALAAARRTVLAAVGESSRMTRVADEALLAILAGPSRDRLASDDRLSGVDEAVVDDYEDSSDEEADTDAAEEEEAAAAARSATRSAPGPMVDEALVEALESAKLAAERASASQQAAYAAKKELDEAAQVFSKVSLRGAVLFTCLDKIAARYEAYRWPLPAFLRAFQQAIEGSGAPVEGHFSKDDTARVSPRSLQSFVEQLITAGPAKRTVGQRALDMEASITVSVLRAVSRSLFFADRMSIAALITVRLCAMRPAPGLLASKFAVTRPVRERHTRRGSTEAPADSVPPGPPVAGEAEARLVSHLLSWSLRAGTVELHPTDRPDSDNDSYVDEFDDATAPADSEWTQLVRACEDLTVGSDSGEAACAIEMLQAAEGCIADEGLAWSAWAASENPLETELPGSLRGAGVVVRLALARLMAPTRLSVCMSALTRIVLGPDAASAVNNPAQPIDSSAVSEASDDEGESDVDVLTPLGSLIMQKIVELETVGARSAVSPVAVLAHKGTDALAACMPAVRRARVNVLTETIGSGRGPAILKMLQSARSKESICMVLLNGAETAEDKLLGDVIASSSEPGSRLILVLVFGAPRSVVVPLMPQEMAARCDRVVLERREGLEVAIEEAFQATRETDAVDRVEELPASQQVFIELARSAVAVYHAGLICRSRYQPGLWEIPVVPASRDASASWQQVRAAMLQVFAAHPDTTEELEVLLGKHIAWPPLRFLVGTIVYGGLAATWADRRSIQAALAPLLNPGALRGRSLTPWVTDISRGIVLPFAKKILSKPPSSSLSNQVLAELLSCVRGAAGSGGPSSAEASLIGIAPAFALRASVRQTQALVSTVGGCIEGELSPSAPPPPTETTDAASELEDREASRMDEARTAAETVSAQRMESFARMVEQEATIPTASEASSRSVPIRVGPSDVSVPPSSLDHLLDSIHAASAVALGDLPAQPLSSTALEGRAVRVISNSAQREVFKATHLLLATRLEAVVATLEKLVPAAPLPLRDESSITGGASTARTGRGTVLGGPPGSIPNPSVVRALHAAVLSSSSHPNSPFVAQAVRECELLAQVAIAALASALSALRCLRGETPPSEIDRQTISAIGAGIVPGSTQGFSSHMVDGDWLAGSWPCEEGVGNRLWVWLWGLQRRAMQLREWCEHAQGVFPVPFWLGGLLRPGAMLLALRQSASRRLSVALDRTALETHVLSASHDTKDACNALRGALSSASSVPGQEALSVVLRGVMLEGAQWGKGEEYSLDGLMCTGTLNRAGAGSPMTELPLVLLRVVEADASWRSVRNVGWTRSDPGLYEAPLYLSPSNGFPMAARGSGPLAIGTLACDAGEGTEMWTRGAVSLALAP